MGIWYFAVALRFRININLSMKGNLPLIRVLLVEFRTLCAIGVAKKNFSSFFLIITDKLTSSFNRTDLVVCFGDLCALYMDVKS